MTRADEQAILELQSRWIEAEIHGDLDTLCAMMTADITMQPPIGEPVVGLAKVRAYLHGPTGHIRSITLSEVSLEVANSMAIKRARFRTDIDGMDPVYGHHLWVLKPSWRVDFVTWSFDRLD
ncbi:nuclear transport factor 2 family protein [Halovulum dunhuangense]|uniref:Nuclear transport factor 2 family protein n=1 Tax=Halovulum dunhuangense TaxID=1505036 RepID=A0A849L2D8_9RHOB|nr:nuclear transport factor 2 family protein [Halovulum dunhuangense]NNU80445.1 nuclear transport factor 2 family protein [Halovulum dunhuangense]